MKSIIQIKNFDFKYTDQYVLKNINLQVTQGTCMGIIGSNGSGKTTLINCILGELYGTGEINVLNMKPNIYSPSFKMNLGVVLDDDILIDYLTLNEYLQYIGKLFHISEVDIKKRIDYWLYFFKLEEHKDRILKFFSHGMRKKTQIIAALIHNPKLLIIDEPTNGLDIEMMYILKKIIVDLKKSGLTILIATHILSFIEEVCDEAIIIHNGVIKRKIQLQLLDPKCSIENIFIDEIVNGGEIL